MYLAGNNEMAPEMYNTLNSINITEATEINIVSEIGRAPYSLINEIRPYERQEIKSSWLGVRQYVYEDNQQKLIDELGNINMADYIFRYM